MKKYNRVIFFRAVLLLAIVGYACFNIFQRQKTANDPTNGFALVELFTSEGCSSCPAADELAAVIDGEKNKNVYVLSFHVDYWNRLGWNDRFSNAAFTNRQEQYAAILKLESIYTPQLVVNGKTEFVGSDERKLRNTIQHELKNTSPAVIELSTGITGSNTLEVSCTTQNASNGILNIALVQKHAETSVKKGENAGKVMKHTNIVRDLKKIAGNRTSTPVAFSSE